jgi:hypothetical protein
MRRLERTERFSKLMSALPPKADIGIKPRSVCFDPNSGQNRAWDFRVLGPELGEASGSDLLRRQASHDVGRTARRNGRISRIIWPGTVTLTR